VNTPAHGLQRLIATCPEETKPALIAELVDANIDLVDLTLNTGVG